MAAPVVAFLLSALLPLSCSQWSDQLAWLYNRQGTDHASALADAAASTCPDVCDCPPTFPVAMYCDGRGLAAVPSVPSHIKYLYLQNNAITAVPDSALANATSLVWLMLHHNQLTSEAIGAKAFLKLEALERLYLQHNNLTSVPANLPRSLKELRINHNKIEKVTVADLEGMDNLSLLYLHDNAIADVGTSLKTLKSLMMLDISSNKLTKVPDSLPEQLHQLYMEHNSIRSLPESFLTALTHLQYVRMAHNQLTDTGVPANAFNVSGLVELDLSFNRLERIPSVSTSLQHLYLQANQIKEFTLGSFCTFTDVSSFSRLQTLRLDGNELSQEDIPSDSSLCLRLASAIDV
uniref:Fibromodulin n=1 Tax=Tetraodon nigroviridis TaxID=99883 RepID=H3CPB2_TETNG